MRPTPTVMSNESVQSTTNRSDLENIIFHDSFVLSISRKRSKRQRVEYYSSTEDKKIFMWKQQNHYCFTKRQSQRSLI